MRRLAGILVLLGLSATPLVAGAQDVPLSFEAAVATAGRNPRVLQTQRAAGVLQRAQDRSPLLDANPVVQVMAGGRVVPSGEQGFEGSLGVTQSIGVNGSAALRRTALGAEARWLDAEADAERLTRQLAAANAWLALREAEEQLRLAGRDLENEGRFVALVTRLAAGGERTAGDVAVAAVRLEEARLRERMAEGAVADARAQVAAELGAPARGAFVTEGAIPEVSLPTAAEQARLLETVASLPQVRARLLLARTEGIRAQEERAMRGTRLTVGVEVRRDALGAGVVQAMVGVPLPIFAVGDREFAARSAAALRMEGEAADERVRARALLLLVAHDVEHSGEVYEALQARLLPTSERALGMRERQLTAGEGTILDVLDARRSYLEASSRLVRATRDRAGARLRLVALHRAARSSE